MGMFDYLRCKYPLPYEGANACLFQTKDLAAMYLDMYEIREDGSMWHEVYDEEDRSDPNAEGLMRLAGMATRVDKRWLPVTDVLGYVYFCAYKPPQLPGVEWIEFKARVIDGKVDGIELVKVEASATAPVKSSV